jgi:hypothetical protein
LFSLLQIGSEENSESLLLFLFQGTEFQAFFSSAECCGTEFREFSVPQQLVLEQTNCSAYSVFRRINFLSEIANPTSNPDCAHFPEPIKPHWANKTFIIIKVPECEILISWIVMTVLPKSISGKATLGQKSEIIKDLCTHAASVLAMAAASGS